MSRCPRRLLRPPPFLLPLPPPSRPRPSSRPVSSLPGPSRQQERLSLLRTPPPPAHALAEVRLPCPGASVHSLFQHRPRRAALSPSALVSHRRPDAAFSPEATGSSPFPRWPAVFSSAPPLPPSGLSSGRWPRIPMPEPARRCACSAAAETEALSSGLPEPFPALYADACCIFFWGGEGHRFAENLTLPADRR